MSIQRLAIAACLAMALASLGQAAESRAPRLPLTRNGGHWTQGHVQGIAVDLRGGYIYYSFTNLLAKYDFDGNLIGTLVGWTGHLGDLDFNPDDGKVYGSLEYNKDKAFYVAVIDVAKLDRVGVEASQTEIFRTVYLPEVTKDYAADLNGDGKFEDGASSPDHRYGCSGIDGVSFGPKFGETGGKRYLTVAYGIFGNNDRTDNDHQVLLQYDIADWARFASPLTEAAPHRNGPAAVESKVFVKTGNTRYGVQNLAYDPSQGRWLMGVYKGAKPGFPNYLMFAVDAAAKPAKGDLVGVPAPDGKGWAQGDLLPLADAGLKDGATGVRGWNQKADVGLQPVGHGLVYLAANSKVDGKQTADLTLMRWTGEPEKPFVPASADDRP